MTGTIEQQLQKHIRYNKGSKQITLGSDDNQIPLRDFFNYLRTQGIEEKDVFSAWERPTGGAPGTGMSGERK